MKVFIPAYFITSGHSVQKWKGTDMESQVFSGKNGDQ